MSRLTSPARLDLRPQSSSQCIAPLNPTKMTHE